MKKIVSYCLISMLTVCALTGCAADNPVPSSDSNPTEYARETAETFRSEAAGSKRLEDASVPEGISGNEDQPAVYMTTDISSDGRMAVYAEQGQAAFAAPEEETEEIPPEDYRIEEFPVVFQMPELPTGCEITAMTMVLNYYGFGVDKTVMAAEYLPTVSANLYYGGDGRLYGSDLRSYFVGDPFTQAGYICGTGAILTAANNYLNEVGSTMRAADKSGASPSELYELVSQDTPVVVWVTIGMEDRRATQGWYTESGDYVEWSTNDHGAVLVGYSEDTVTIADPISGMTEYSRTQFESVYASRGFQSVILENRRY